jgi:hypothetical protein
MANCNKCPFYDAEYDRIKSGLDDVIIEGEEHEEHHFCIMHKEHIDDYFVHGKKCPHDVK